MQAEGESGGEAGQLSFSFLEAEGEDVAEAFDEVFLHSGAVALEQAKRVGGFSTVKDGALDVGLIADEKQRQTILGREAGALGVGQRSNCDRLALAGQRVFLEAETEGFELRFIAGIGGYLAVCEAEARGFADGFFPIDHPFAEFVAGEGAQALRAGEFLEHDKP